MWWSGLAIGALLLAGGAAAQSNGNPAQPLRDAAFAPVERPDPQVEQRLRRDGRFYVFAGARAAESFRQGDPRWSPRNDVGAGASLVETKVGVGWRNGGLETSLGYMKRQITEAPMLADGRPKRDSMVGVSLKLRSGF